MPRYVWAVGAGKWAEGAPLPCPETLARKSPLDIHWVSFTIRQPKEVAWKHCPVPDSVLAPGRRFLSACSCKSHGLAGNRGSTLMLFFLREQARRQQWPWYCPGCYTAVSQVPAEKEPLLYDPARFQIQKPTLPTLEPSLQELLFKLRAKRSARGAARGKQRSGARAVCRGCYSGLMIVAPPAQGSKNETWIGSHSESEGDSSEEDTLPPKA
ncbi:uncharacterized protein LOC114607300 [Podarcis muralis]